MSYDICAQFFCGNKHTLSVFHPSMFVCLLLPRFRADVITIRITCPTLEYPFVIKMRKKNSQKEVALTATNRKKTN